MSLNELIKGLNNESSILKNNLISEEERITALKESKDYNNVEPARLIKSQLILDQVNLIDFYPRIEDVLIDVKTDVHKVFGRIKTIDGPIIQVVKKVNVIKGMVIPEKNMLRNELEIQFSYFKNGTSLKSVIGFNFIDKQWVLTEKSSINFYDVKNLTGIAIDSYFKIITSLSDYLNNRPPRPIV